jgi:hypothetical protein
MNSAPSQPPAHPKRRPRFQFTVTGLLVLMFAAGALMAPGYYLFHQRSGLPQGQLVGMLMMLAGPLLIMTLLSIFLSLTGRGNDE